MFRTSIITAIALGISTHASSTCILRPVGITVLTVDQCVSTVFSKHSTTWAVGTESIEGVILGGIVNRAWHIWPKETKNIEALPKPQTGYRKGSSAIFFLNSKSCMPHIGKTVNLVENFRCCDTFVQSTGPVGVCILPYTLPDVRIVSDTELTEFELSPDKAR
jgi:hypothetical protein